MSARNFALVVILGVLWGCSQAVVRDDLGVEEPPDLRGARPEDLRGAFGLPDLRAPVEAPDLRAPPADLRMPPPPDLREPADLAAAPRGIGDPCTDSAQCKTGPAPVCWKNTVLDKMGYSKTPGGYCSSTCTSDMDCGGAGTCGDFGADGMFCLRFCRDAATCRHPGYACRFYGSDGICYPEAIFDCDPKVAACTQAGTGLAGGCERRAYEDKGTCRASCGVGVGSCLLLGLLSQQCVYYDGTGAPFLDAFKGPICLPSPAAPVMPGGGCLYLNQCTDGYQCDSLMNTCQKLCVKGGTPACSGGMSCADAFGTAADGPGLCR